MENGSSLTVDVLLYDGEPSEEAKEAVALLGRAIDAFYEIPDGIGRAMKNALSDADDCERQAFAAVLIAAMHRKGFCDTTARLTVEFREPDPERLERFKAKVASGEIRAMTREEADAALARAKTPTA